MSLLSPLRVLPTLPFRPSWEPGASPSCFRETVVVARILLPVVESLAAGLASQYRIAAGHPEIAGRSCPAHPRRHRTAGLARHLGFVSRSRSERIGLGLEKRKTCQLKLLPLFNRAGDSRFETGHKVSEEVSSGCWWASIRTVGEGESGLTAASHVEIIEGGGMYEVKGSKIEKSIGRKVN